MRFLHFFDWSLLEFPEFEFYRVRIAGSEHFPHLIGRDALVPVGQSVRILFEDAQ